MSANIRRSPQRRSLGLRHQSSLTSLLLRSFDKVLPRFVEEVELLLGIHIRHLFSFIQLDGPNKTSVPLTYPVIKFGKRSTIIC